MGVKLTICCLAATLFACSKTTSVTTIYYSPLKSYDAVVKKFNPNSGVMGSCSKGFSLSYNNWNCSVYDDKLYTKIKDSNTVPLNIKVKYVSKGSDVDSCEYITLWPGKKDSVKLKQDLPKSILSCAQRI